MGSATIFVQVKTRPVSNPPNPWSSTDTQYLDEIPRAQLRIYEDASKSILSHNDSPDVGFDWSVNPYRGCIHACAYCYARPGHQYLDFGAGTDFETRIVVKPRAPELLREAFEKPSWKGDLVVFSGVTDCYQPLEASLRLTRQCLEVCAEYRNPVAIITKGPLIERDLDVLQRLHEVCSVRVRVSVPFFFPETARAIEPYVATPQRRLQTIRTLAEAGIRVGVNVAPLIPGLSDEEMPRVLEAAAEAGASSAAYVMLRLPGEVKAVFEERIREKLPLRAERILHRVRETRGGKLYDNRFGTRGRGTGIYADVLADLFDKTARRVGLKDSCFPEPDARPSTFTRPAKPPKPSKPQPQLGLFD